MISGRAILKQAGLLLALCAPLASASAASAWTLPELLHTLASRGDSRANFVEIRTLALLSQPLRLEGSVEFRPPAYLAKHVRLPAEEHYIIDGNALRIERPGQAPLQLALSDYPALEAFAASLRAPLAGDGAALQRYYRVSLGGSRRHWLLALVPLQPEMVESIRRVTLAGSGDHIERLDIEEAGGDRSSLRFQPHP